MTHEIRQMAENCCNDVTIVTKPNGGNCILPIPAFKQGEELSPGQWRCYNGGMYVSCKAFDGSLNYPDSKFFKGPHTLEDVLNAAVRSCGSPTMPLEVAVWESCNSNPNCVRQFPLGGCALDYDPEAQDYRLYTSLIEDNHDKPYYGSKKDPATWDGGFTVCEYLNRPVTVNENGELHYPGNPETRLCSISCDAPMEPLVWRAVNGLKRLTVAISRGLHIVGGAIEAKIGKALNFRVNPMDPDDPTNGTIDWQYDSNRGVGVSEETNQAYVKIAPKQG
ncbi:MAG TPA: hypothetical protein PLB10_18715, partial [Thiolinea sp.]|nr:hypothetical protein [Thiolinea sp.]